MKIKKYASPKHTQVIDWKVGVLLDYNTVLLCSNYLGSTASKE